MLILSGQKYAPATILMQVIYRRKEFHEELALGFGFWHACVCWLEIQLSSLETLLKTFY